MGENNSFTLDTLSLKRLGHVQVERAISCIRDDWAGRIKLGVYQLRDGIYSHAN